MSVGPVLYPRALPKYAAFIYTQISYTVDQRELRAHAPRRPKSNQAPTSALNVARAKPHHWVFFCPAPPTKERAPGRGTTCGTDRRGAQSNMKSFSLPSRQRVSHTLHEIMWYATSTGSVKHVARNQRGPSGHVTYHLCLRSASSAGSALGE